METFTPRTVIYDLKGGFGSLRKLNALYESENDPTSAHGLWDGPTSAQRQQPIQPSRYQTLLDQSLPTFQVQQQDVRYWSDFNRVFYHPRSAVQLNQYDLNSQLMPFEKWSAGEELFHDLDKEVDILDRDVRPFAEECDNIQGFQMITGADDAWGGFAARYLDSLRDEYGKTSIWTYGIEDGTPAPRNVRTIRSGNAARSMRSLAQQSSAYISLNTDPKPVPAYVNLYSQSEWLTSALLCSAIESATLPSRLVGTATQQPSLSLLEDMLNTNGSQRLLELQMTVDDAHESRPDPQPNGMANGMSNGSSDAMKLESSSLDMTFLSGQQAPSKSDHHVFAQVETRRSRHQRPFKSEMDPEERMRMRHHEETVVDQYNTNLLFPKLDTFPASLFRVNQQNEGMSLTTSLRTSSNLKDHVLSLRDQSLRGLDLDEREDMYNDLTELANGYSFGWDGGSDSDEDE